MDAYAMHCEYSWPTHNTCVYVEAEMEQGAQRRHTLHSFRPLTFPWPMPSFPITPFCWPFLPLSHSFRLNERVREHLEMLPNDLCSLWRVFLKATQGGRPVSSPITQENSRWNRPQGRAGITLRWRRGRSLYDRLVCCKMRRLGSTELSNPSLLKGFTIFLGLLALRGRPGLMRDLMGRKDHPDPSSIPVDAVVPSLFPKHL
jgi:hypothetical protein